MVPLLGKPSVFVAMPRYGDLSEGAARGLYVPTRGAVHIWNVGTGCNSLTPNAFNDLLCAALTARDAGAITHFAMIHADVEPVGYWLDDLWDEMKKTEADLISAVIPIKLDVSDPPTSTAFGDRNDPWKVNRRLHVSDRATTPETFGQEACGPDEVLLVNTGLWLTDLRCPAWNDFPGFRIVTEINRGADGLYSARCRPEDWEMSRHLHARGADVRATWRVPVGHRGTKVWTNHSLTPKG